MTTALPPARIESERAQANLLALPRDMAYDFLLFCQRNSRVCGLVDVSEPGGTVLARCAPRGDLRRDAPRYRIWRDGELVETVTDATPWWRDDLVTFALGCSFTFAVALKRAGISFRTGGVYRSVLPCVPAGRLAGEQWVSMRSMTSADAVRAAQITARFPSAHGAPLHIGDPAAIGVEDIARPTWTLGPFEPLPDDHVPVFWGCSVTAENVVRAARPELMISLEPPQMLRTDLLVEELATA